MLGLLLRLAPALTVVVALLRTDLFALGLWITTAAPQQLSHVLSTALTPLDPIRTLATALGMRWPADEQLVGAAALAALGVAGMSLVRRTLSFFQDRETRRWLNETHLKETDRQEGNGRWGVLRWTAAITCVSAAALVVPSGLLVGKEWPRLKKEQAVEAYLSALADPSPRRLCAVTVPHIKALVDQGLTCGGQAPRMRNLCKGVREALAALPEQAVRVTGTEVRVSWAPEPVPACTNPAGGLALTPTELQEQDDGSWKVSRVGVDTR